MAEDDFAALRATAALFPDGLVESELGKCRRVGGFNCWRSNSNSWRRTPSTKNVDFGTMVFTIGQHLKTYQI